MTPPENHPLQERLQQALGMDYRIERELGRGGMATVFLAEDLRHRRRVAVKVVHPELGVELASQRFQREIEIAASLNHPHILPLLDSGSAGDVAYYIMPYVEGESLRSRLDRERQLPVDEAVRLAHDVASALQHAHERGLVHRDIKPENILLAGGGKEAVVTDFGIARWTGPESVKSTSLTRAGLVVGTPLYMSPEQASGQPDLDGRSDVYSLGCVLYEMLVGHPPFLGANSQELIARHTLDPIPPARTTRPTVPEALETALQRALAKTPADRFRSAGQFAELLEEIRRLGPMVPSAQRPSMGRAAGWRRSPAFRIVGLTGGVAIAAILALFGVRWMQPEGRFPAADPFRLAVLPLRTVGLEDTTHFAEGLTDELTTRLARVARLVVIARNNTAHYQSGQKTVAEIGRELGVDYLLEGSVRWTDAEGERRFRVTPSLVRVSDGADVWNQSVDGVLADVFDLQSTIAQRVAEALQLQLPAAERRALLTPATSSVEAYNEYVLGRFYWQKRMPDDLLRAVQHFDRALELDSVFARAKSGLADCYILFAQYGVTAVPRDVAWSRAREAAEQALALDSTLVEAYASAGEVLLYADWDWAGAERRFREAIRHDANYATAHQWFAELLAVVGRFDEAVLEGQQAVRLDPLSPVTNLSLGLALLGARRYPEAVAQLRRVLEMAPSLAYANAALARAYIGLDNYEAAIAAMARAGDTTNLTRLWIRAAIDPRTRPEARRVLLERRAEVEAWPPEVQAQAYAVVGDRDRALAALERLAMERAPIPPGVLLSAQYDPIRDDPRFKEIVRRMGFP